jgi:hypothetical protein
LQNTRKSADSPIETFPELSRDLLGLLHDCCTNAKVIKPANIQIRRSTTIRDSRSRRKGSGYGPELPKSELAALLALLRSLIPLRGILGPVWV